MTVLSRHPVTAAALNLARRWCAGRVIDGAPALRHAVHVARKLDDHLPGVSPVLLAAALLHDSPYFAPDGEDLDAVLDAEVAPGVATIVRGLEREHQALANNPSPQITTDNTATLYASAADKIVSLTAILLRAADSADPAIYWSSRSAFLRRVPYFRAFEQAAAPHLPERMARELALLVDAAGQARRQERRGVTTPAR